MLLENIGRPIALFSCKYSNPIFVSTVRWLSQCLIWKNRDEDHKSQRGLTHCGRKMTWICDVRCHRPRRRPVNSAADNLAKKSCGERDDEISSTGTAIVFLFWVYAKQGQRMSRCPRTAKNSRSGVSLSEAFEVTRWISEIVKIV